MGGFKKFLMRGNLIDLAVAVVVGVAFNAVVQALVTDLITPLIAAAGGKPDFSRLHFTVHNSTFLYGSFVNAVVSFLIIAAVVYFLLVMPSTRITARLARRQEATE
ncbi:MAG: large conductance mechanosensitive channel protein MscL, partial [Actinobacteria bacterium]|nr:large conductance mechanosensitive channel protein MscL [Actinomycetota bacterium]